MRPVPRQGMDLDRIASLAGGRISAEELRHILTGRDPGPGESTWIWRTIRDMPRPCFDAISTEVGIAPECLSNRLVFLVRA